MTNTDKTPTWHGRHGKGAMKVHRAQKKLDAIARAEASKNKKAEA
jgi:hypothetical protein